MGPGEYAEFHLGQEPLDNVGDFGSHFKGSPLNKSFYPLETCLLYLEFPADLPDSRLSMPLYSKLEKLLW